MGNKIASYRKVLTLVSSILFAVVAQGQWQPCSPGSSLCQTGGNVGIGTSNPSQSLDVNGTVLSKSFGVGGVASTGYPFFATSSVASLPTAVQLRSNYWGTAASFFGNFGNFGTYLSQNRDPQYGAFVEGAAAPNQYKAVQLVLGDTERGRLLQVANFPNGDETVRLFIGYNGNVGIGTITPTVALEVNGSIKATSVIGATYQDVAEWVPVTETVSPGTVVVVADALNTVAPSHGAYDTRVAGVVSLQPGVILGVEGPSKAMIATTGRVKVRVDASRGAIRPGDLLVTSERSGIAMRSDAVEVAGVKMHRPGTLIGKALEPLDRGEGEILVLLSLQ